MEHFERSFWAVLSSSETEPECFLAFKKSQSPLKVMQSEQSLF